MTSPTLLLLPLLAVSFGYEPSSDADTGYDYTVQVEPELLEQMQRDGTQTIEANIPAEVTPIRRIRIVVGTDPLPKRLRSTAISQTTYRQNVDGAAVPGIDLLAQTGPGFGRDSTGFNAGSRGTYSPTATQTAPQTTVPAIGTDYRTSSNDVRGQLDAGFQAVESGLGDARDTVRNTVNNVGTGGQRVIDNTRQLLSDVVAPPENRSFDTANTPLENLADRTRQEFQNTGPAVRDSMDRAGETIRGAFDDSRYGSPTTSTDTNTTPATRWTGGDLERYSTGERSVLTTPNNTSAPSGGLTQAERDQLDRIERDRQLQQFRAAQAAAAEREAAARNSTFPQRPVYQQLPERTPDDVLVSLGNRPLSNGMSEVAVNNGFDQNQTNAGPSLGAPQTGNAAWMNNQPVTTPNSTPPSIGSGPPAIQTVQNTSRPTNDEAVASWLDGQRTDDLTTPTQPSDSSSTPVWLLGWTIAVGSVVTNLFQWLNIVDMRNKYRVALRRGSPNFSRSMAA